MILMSSLFDCANISMISYHPDTRVAEANPAACATLGLSWEQMVGRPISDGVWSFVREDGTPLPPEDHPVSRALATRGEVRDLVIGADRPGTGERVWLLANAFCEVEGDDVRRVTVILVDVTKVRSGSDDLRTAVMDLKQQLAEAQLAESVGQLASGIAHQFNNVLMIQKGYCEILRSSLHEDESLEKVLAEIEGCADQAVELTRRLLALGRRQTSSPADVDLNRVVEDSAPVLQKLVGESIRLKTEYAVHPALAIVDSTKIEQILITLAANGRDSLPNGGTLHVGVRWIDVDEPLLAGETTVDPGGYVELSVGGLASEVDAAKHSPLGLSDVAAGDSAARRLALPAVRGVVQRLGGHVLVDHMPDKGTTVRLVFPRVEMVLPEHTEVAEHPANEESQLVLVVEDEAALRGIVVMMAERLGYRVAEASKGPEALALVENQDLRPDVLLTDLVMPEMNGRDLAERMRRLFPDLKVIYMSGYASGSIVDLELADPNVSFLRKPFSTADLRFHLERVVHGSAAR
jgi:CheY-like chemotaxis protein/signal transduction histidine kinase